ncbi:hypothetical protein Bca4012_084152 [Brassica carinata]|uniref:Uncharacterized protein n=1 Tax=Brassica carinata TaxID=52824 RepID=A0A8X7V9Z7_BRACI|nr:hypothetical protein Bca52824_026634 [Brassica carinata]
MGGEANSSFKSWATKMSLLHRPTLRKAGILEAVILQERGSLRRRSVTSLILLPCSFLDL